MNRLWIVAAALAFAGTASAETFDLNASGHSVGASLSGPLGRMSPESHGEYEAGALFHSQSDRDFNEGYVGLRVAGDLGVRGAKVDGTLGLRGYYLDGEHASGEAVAIGGSVNARLREINRVIWSVYGYYSPDPLSFSDVHEYVEFGLSVGYELLHNAVIYGGYRNVEVDFSGDGSHTVDNGLLAGVRLSF
jgi:hypothetical protein